jgi:uncharacterized membrane protein
MTLSKTERGIIEALAVSNGVSLVLFVLRLLATGSTQYWFLFWNLFLAWVPVLMAWMLLKKLSKHSWRSLMPILLTLLWLGFLPNSFYLMSDLIHLESTGDVGVLFDAVLFLSFIWNGMVAGLISLVWVQRAVAKRASSELTVSFMGAVILLTSFAIYLGRSLRWNTWDVLVNPAGILFDVTERVVNPLAHPQAFSTTLTFFVLIGSIYLVVWNFAKLIPVKNRR